MTKKSIPLSLDVTKNIQFFSRRSVACNETSILIQSIQKKTCIVIFFISGENTLCYQNNRIFFCFIILSGTQWIQYDPEYFGQFIHIFYMFDCNIFSVAIIQYDTEYFGLHRNVSKTYLFLTFNYLITCWEYKN